MSEVIKIGTRKSKLAVWQAEYVAGLLQAGGLQTELVLMETKGDKVLDVSIAKIGSKGVFTEELEEKLATGAIDIAVHSAKDMQSQLLPGFELIAFTEREVVNDVIVADKPVSLNSGVTLGTSSTRRVATLKHFYPNVKTAEIRGNLQTRLEKMRAGVCDALLLAYAGVHRMGYHDLIKEKLSLSEFIPAVGQGSVTVEVHASLGEAKRLKVRELVNHVETEQRILAERAFLRRLEGGCSIPVFALAELNEQQVEIKGGIVSLDGKERIVKSVVGSDPESCGLELAEALLVAGGDKVLKDIKNQI